MSIEISNRKPEGDNEELKKIREEIVSKAPFWRVKLNELRLRAEEAAAVEQGCKPSLVSPPEQS